MLTLIVSPLNLCLSIESLFSMYDQPKYLGNNIKRVQKQELRIISPFKGEQHVKLNFPESLQVVTSYM